MTGSSLIQKKQSSRFLGARKNECCAGD
jgi:hypothetical protein